MEEEMITTAIQFPRDLYDRIKKAAEADERSMAYIIRKATQIFLDTQAEPQPQPATREKKAGK